MSSVAKLVVPEALGTTYRWAFGNVSFEVDAGHGARVVGFRFGNENILTTADVNALNFGSTFWTSGFGLCGASPGGTDMRDKSTW